MTRPRLSPLCFDRLFDHIKIVYQNTVAITLAINGNHIKGNQQSNTEKGRDQCFDQKIVDRFRTNYFNELVHMNMDLEINKFFAHHKILHSSEEKIVLESENEHFTEDFYQQFLSLIERIEGNLLLTSVEV